MTDKLLDSPKTTIMRAKILQKKPFLRSVYLSFYKEIKRQLKNARKGKVIELGSGGGFIKEVIPNVVTSDIMKLPNCDLKFSAEKMPFKNSSVSAFVMLNVFHHIKNPKSALSEFQRCLKSGGRVIMIEPFNSPWSRFIYRNFHHETFNPNANWKIKEKGDLSGANGSLAWIIFQRDIREFKRLYPRLKLFSLRPHTPFAYLLSGGFTLPTIVPLSFYQSVTKIEKLFYPLNKYLGMFSTIVLKKLS